MADSLIDDVKALLDKDFGDDRILKQIYRACENDEVISNYERNYVRKLAEKYLGRRPEINEMASHTEEKPLVPDVVIPVPHSLTNVQTLHSKPRKSSSNPNNSKIMLGVGAAILGIIVIIAVSINGVPSTTKASTDLFPVTLSIKTDLLSYDKNDIISISGTSDVSEDVSLSIVNPSDVVVWEAPVSLKNDGTYSTLSIAGGQGWEISGTYTIKVNNDAETKSSTFSFTT